jgi:hypothetical protein
MAPTIAQNAIRVLIKMAGPENLTSLATQASFEHHLSKPCQHGPFHSFASLLPSLPTGIKPTSTLRDHPLPSQPPMGVDHLSE